MHPKKKKNEKVCHKKEGKKKVKEEEREGNNHFSSDFKVTRPQTPYSESCNWRKELDTYSAFHEWTVPQCKSSSIWWKTFFFTEEFHLIKVQEAIEIENLNFATSTELIELMIMMEPLDKRRWGTQQRRGQAVTPHSAKLTPLRFVCLVSFLSSESVYSLFPIL